MGEERAGPHTVTVAMDISEEEEIVAILVAVTYQAF
jgi:hypothetical protein